MSFQPLEKLYNLEDGYRKPIKLGGQSLLLLHVQGKTYLIKNACPHLGASLTHATLVDRSLRCPSHGIHFDLHTGCATNAPGCREQLQFIPLIYEGSLVGVDWVE